MTAESAGVVEREGLALREHALRYPVVDGTQAHREDAIRVFQVDKLTFRVGLALVMPPDEPEPWWTVGVAVSQGPVSIPAMELTGDQLRLADGLAMRVLGDAGRKGVDHENRHPNGMMVVYTRRASAADYEHLERMVITEFTDEPLH